VRERDKNTNFFPWVANSHRRNNLVISLVINGSITSNSIEIKDHIVQFYKMYSEQCSWQPKLDRLSFLSFNADERGWLDRESKENEAWEVVKDLNCDKVELMVSLWLFSQKSLKVMKDDILAILRSFIVCRSLRV
jgi:hypothetical protein